MHDDMVGHEPLGMVKTRERLRIDMIAEPKHPYDRFEVAASLGVVAGKEVQRDWDMAADVDGLDEGMEGGGGATATMAGAGRAAIGGVGARAMAVVAGTAAAATAGAGGAGAPALAVEAGTAAAVAAGAGGPVARGGSRRDCVTVGVLQCGESGIKII